tara:strand:+ start:1191 stop:1613 length:423 start_codon:yes stop_codon:yes gene_type:complete
MLAQYESSEVVGGIVGSCVFGYIAINFFVGLFSPEAKPLSDRFELGYIDDNDSNDKVEVAIEEKDELQELRRQVEIAKLKKQLSELEEPSFDKVLFKDCVDALTGLGTPARKAKAEAQTIFEKNPNIKTVQEFITEYGKR